MVEDIIQIVGRYNDNKTKKIKLKIKIKTMSIKHNFGMTIVDHILILDKNVTLGINHYTQYGPRIFYNTSTTLNSR